MPSSIGYARTTVTTVGTGCAVLAFRATISAQAIAAGDPEVVEIAFSRVAHAAAALVGRRADAAGVVLEMAGVALWTARLRVAANAELCAGLYGAGHVAGTGQIAGRVPSTAVCVAPAQFAGQMTTTGGLTNRHAAGAVGSAKSAAALVAGRAHGARGTGRTIGRSRWRVPTNAYAGAVRTIADAGAAIATAPTDVAFLDAVRSAQRANSIRAEGRATIAVVGAGVAGSFATEIEGSARPIRARAAATLAVVFAAVAIAGAGVGAAPHQATETTTI